MNVWLVLRNFQDEEAIYILLLSQKFKFSHVNEIWFKVLLITTCVKGSNICMGFKNMSWRATCRTSVYDNYRVITILFFGLHLGNGHDIALNFNAHREKLLNEVVNIQSKDEEKNLKIVIHARVLGKFLFILINLTLNIFWVSKIILLVHVLDKYCKICIFILIKISLYSGYQNSYYR